MAAAHQLLPNSGEEISRFRARKCGAPQQIEGVVGRGDIWLNGRDTLLNDDATGDADTLSQLQLTYIGPELAMDALARLADSRSLESMNAFVAYKPREVGVRLSETKHT